MNLPFASQEVRGCLTTSGCLPLLEPPVVWYAGKEDRLLPCSASPSGPVSPRAGGVDTFSLGSSSPSEMDGFCFGSVGLLLAAGQLWSPGGRGVGILRGSVQGHPGAFHSGCPRECQLSFPLLPVGGSVLAAPQLAGVTSPGWWPPEAAGDSRLILNFCAHVCGAPRSPAALFRTYESQHGVLAPPSNSWLPKPWSCLPFQVQASAGITTSYPLTPQIPGDIPPALKGPPPCLVLLHPASTCGLVEPVSTSCGHPCR